MDRFDAARYETQKVEGHWRSGNIMYRDELVKIVIDSPDIPESRKWMRQFMLRWKYGSEAHDVDLKAGSKLGVSLTRNLALARR